MCAVLANRPNVRTRRNGGRHDRDSDGPLHTSNAAPPAATWKVVITTARILGCGCRRVTTRRLEQRRLPCSVLAQGFEPGNTLP